MSLPQLRRRNRGRYVAMMQQSLLDAAGSDQNDCLGVPFPRGQRFTADGNFGSMTEQAVRAFQTRTQRMLADDDFGIDGICGSDTWTALGVTNAVTVPRSPRLPASPATPATPPARSQGRPLGQSAPAAAGYVGPPQGQAMPPWMAVAWQQESRDTVEMMGGRRNNPIIVDEYMAISGSLRNIQMSSGNPNAQRIMSRARDDDARRVRRVDRQGRNLTAQWVDSFDNRTLGQVDEFPWCGCFVQWCLLQVGGTRRHNFGSARGWRPQGSEPQLQQYGSVCSVRHTGGGFHVGFFLQSVGSGVKLLGGNQAPTRGASSRVCVKDYSDIQDYTCIWPEIAAA